MSNINPVGVKNWTIKSLIFSDVNILVSLENTFTPLWHKSYSVNKNNSSGIKCSDEFGEHAHQN